MCKMGSRYFHCVHGGVEIDLICLAACCRNKAASCSGDILFVLTSIRAMHADVLWSAKTTYSSSQRNECNEYVQQEGVLTWPAPCIKYNQRTVWKLGFTGDWWYRETCIDQWLITHVTCISYRFSSRLLPASSVILLALLSLFFVLLLILKLDWTVLLNCMGPRDIHICRPAQLQHSFTSTFMTDKKKTLSPCFMSPSALWAIYLQCTLACRINGNDVMLLKVSSLVLQRLALVFWDL